MKITNGIQVFGLEQEKIKGDQKGAAFVIKGEITHKIPLIEKAIFMRILTTSKKKN